MPQMKLMMPKGQKPACLATLGQKAVMARNGATARAEIAPQDAQLQPIPSHAAITAHQDQSGVHGMKRLSFAAVAAAMVLASAPALAQTKLAPTATAPAAGSSSGTASTPVKSPSQVDEGQLNILPSAGSSGPSAAPTMIFNCKERPTECTEQVKPGDKATAPKLSN